MFLGIWMGVERQTDACDGGSPQGRSPLRRVCRIVCDLPVRIHERIPGAPGSMGWCMDSTRSGARLHFNHVLWRRTLWDAY